MGRYAAEPDNATKAAKAKGSNLRVHFKVNILFVITFGLTDIPCFLIKKSKKEGDCCEELKGGRCPKSNRKPPIMF